MAPKPKDTPLAALHEEYDRLAALLDAARPAGGSRDEMLAAVVAMREVVDDTRLLADTVTLAAYETTTASTTDIGVAYGLDYDRTMPQARTNAQRRLAGLRAQLPARRAERGLVERLVA